MNDSHSPVILLLEDDTEQAALLLERLTDQGFKVFNAINVDQAVKLLIDYQGRIDKIICDNWVDSVEAGPILRGMAETLRINCLVISGMSAEGVDLLKPFRWADLMGRL